MTSRWGSCSGHSFIHQIFIANLLHPSHSYVCWRSSNKQNRKGPCFHEVYVLSGETDDKNGKAWGREGYVGISAANKQGKRWREGPVTWRGWGCVCACASSAEDKGLRGGNSFACSRYVQGDPSEWVRGESPGTSWGYGGRQQLCRSC